MRSRISIAQGMYAMSAFRLLESHPVPVLSYIRPKERANTTPNSSYDAPPTSGYAPQHNLDGFRVATHSLILAPRGFDLALYGLAPIS